MPKRGVNKPALASFHAAQRSAVLRTFDGIGGLQVVSVPPGGTVAGLIASYQQSGLVEYAEPDYLYHASAVPNDPKYLDGTLWGLNNTGQNSGKPDADIDAPEGWDVLFSASNIVVAVLDTGIRSTHEDLASNMWVNPGDGGHGFNALAPGTPPEDDNGHGTLVAGVLGAVGNNGLGVVGVAWKVQLMSCKCLNSGGTGDAADIVAGIDYARTNGAKIINASLDSASFSLALSNAIVAARDAGIIFVASCGNGPPVVNVDSSPRYPACNNINNIVSVAYSTRNDTLGFFSNFGATNVDLAAPGDEVFSTYYTADNAYYPPSFFTIAGTSFAAPEVSGTLALLLAKFPAENYQLTISRLLNAVDPVPALAGKCVTGGRLNLRNALSPPIKLTLLAPTASAQSVLHLASGPNRTCVIQASPDLATWTNVFTNVTSTNGTFDFPDPGSTNSGLRYYRAQSGL